jgi:hypothetical protein
MASGGYSIGGYELRIINNGDQSLYPIQVPVYIYQSDIYADTDNVR